jgi:succinylarginine dihydrolase
VVAVSNGATLIFHEDACDDADAVIEALRRKLAARGAELLAAAARREALSLSEAVASYVFNSQLVTLPDGAAALIAPAEAEASPRARAFVAEAMAAGAFREVHYVDVRESMRNGGGPACLRLRVVLTGAERAALAGATLMDEARLDAVEALVRAHYRDRLDPADLVDPQLLEESRTFLDRLSALLGLGAIHDFQRN